MKFVVYILTFYYFTSSFLFFLFIFCFFCAFFLFEVSYQVLVLIIVDEFVPERGQV